MYLQTLKVFADLASTGSFSKAGEANGISQSAVSQKITVLERTLGAQLVERGGRAGLVLTEEGMVFLNTASEILEAYARCVERLSLIKKVIRGRVRVLVAPCILQYELGARLEAFHSAYPEVRVDVITKPSAEIYDALLLEEAEMGLVAQPIRRKGFQIQTLGREDIVAVCAPGHPLAMREHVFLRELLGEKLGILSCDHGVRSAMERYFRSQGFDFPALHEHDLIGSVKDAVLSGSLVTFLPRNLLAKDVEEGRLKEVELKGPVIRRSVGLIALRKKPRSAAYRALVEVLLFGAGDHMELRLHLKRGN
jgi:LysR family cyn operon transcriptional activator